MKKVGLTGGIGSGKSTVAKLWQEWGAFVVLADDLAKELMITNSSLKKQLKEVFGDDTYLKDGTLNKPFLIKEAFESGRVDELNRLVHPVVLKETDNLAKKARKEGYPLFVKEAALLLNNGRPKMLDVIVLVTADEEIRIDRVMKRDNSNKEAVIQRMKKQPDFNRLADLCDIVIENNGTEKELEEKAKRVFDGLVR